VAEVMILRVQLLLVQQPALVQQLVVLLLLAQQLVLLLLRQVLQRLWAYGRVLEQQQQAQLQQGHLRQQVLQLRQLVRLQPLLLLLLWKAL
jgi:hypothetical protein